MFRISGNRRLLEKKQKLVEASYAKNNLIKALKDDDLEKARKALHDLVSAQGYASSPAQELELTDKEFSEFSKLLDAGSDLATKPGGTGDIMDAARQILGVGKNTPRAWNGVPGQNHPDDPTNTKLQPKEKTIMQNYIGKRKQSLEDCDYYQLVSLYDYLMHNTPGGDVHVVDDLLLKITLVAQKMSSYKDSDFPDV